jgi:hypothetical protein
MSLRPWSRIFTVPDKHLFGQDRREIVHPTGPPSRAEGAASRGDEHDRNRTQIASADFQS